MPRPLAILLPSIGLTAALAWPNAAAAGEPKRSGGQAELVFGGSACIPASGDCRADNGKSGVSGALGIDLGWRAHKVFFLGAGYTVGWFNPTWHVGGRQLYRTGFQQGVFGVLRVYIPIWRFDIGFELSPGWSRQTFVADTGGRRDYSQGFALRPGTSLDIRLGRHLFVGGRIDFLFNFHRQLCSMQGNDRNCAGELDIRQLPVHQVIGGIHFGANF